MAIYPLGSSRRLSATLSWSGRGATLNPARSLVSGREYAVSLLAGITDPGGHALAPVSWTVTIR